MKTRIIQLTPDDDIVSVRDRLNWMDEPRALLVLPEQGGVLGDGLDLVQLRRYADKLRLEVGLVTADTAVTQQARALGLPTFTSIASGKLNQPEWWRRRRREEWVGLPVGGLPRLRQWTHHQAQGVEDAGEVRRRQKTRPTWRVWLRRYLTLFLFFITLALLSVAFAYTVPGATITLHPKVLPLQISRQVVADPFANSENANEGVVPARILTATETWTASVETTGVVDVPNASAQGVVIFVNKLDEAVVVPAGTRVRTSTGDTVVFQTLESVTVEGGVGNTAEVAVIAIEPGPQGNITANGVNVVEGSLSLELDVRNLEAMEGGSFRQATAVTQADQDRLHSQVLQFVQALALAEMETELTAREFLPAASLSVVAIQHETYSHFVGEQTSRLTLEIQAEVRGTAVDTSTTIGSIYTALAAQVPPGYELVPESIRLEKGDVVAVDEAGRVTLAMNGWGMMAAQLHLTEPLVKISGQERQTAVTYLYNNLPLRDIPQIKIWPGWFTRLPYTPSRMETIIETNE